MITVLNVRHRDSISRASGRSARFINLDDFGRFDRYNQLRLIEYWDQNLQGHIRLPAYLETPDGRNRSTRQKVKDMRAIHPALPAVTIAQETGVSRERIRQILKAEGLATRVRAVARLCISCGEPMPKKQSPYCSQRCRSKALRMAVECGVCFIE